MTMKEKRVDFELLRLFALILVVFNHTQECGFELYQVSGVSGINAAGSLILAVFCKIAVPLFLMVSGGLLLHREEPVTTVLRKRVVRIVVVLVVCSGLLYGCWIRWGYVPSPGLRDFAKRLWGQGISIPYWYLYCYLGLMLMLPLLRCLVRGMPDQLFLYLGGLYVLFQGILEPVAVLLGVGEPFGMVTVPGAQTLMNVFLPFCEQILFYFLMGYYFAHRFSWERVTGRVLFLMSIASVAVIALLATVSWRQFQLQGSHRLYTGGLLCVPVFTVYMLAHRLGEKIKGRPAELICVLGGCTFGGYLLEGFLRYELYPVYENLEPVVHVLPACMLWVLSVVICGLGITWILKKIPGIRKFL